MACYLHIMLARAPRSLFLSPSLPLFLPPSRTSPSLPISLSHTGIGTWSSLLLCTASSMLSVGSCFACRHRLGAWCRCEGAAASARSVLRA
eukprot:2081868-Rhodomonas_salina.1